jgi:hypothetical protein
MGLNVKKITYRKNDCFNVFKNETLPNSIRYIKTNSYLRENT